MRARAIRPLAQDLQQAIEAALGPGEGELRYPGTCRDAAVDGARERARRVRMEREAISFRDLRLGTIEQVPSDQAGDVHGAKVILASFLVLFAAEWGDLSQLLTLTLVAKYDAPASVFVGALGALLAVSGLAVVVGRTLMRYIRLHVLHYVGAVVCLGLAALTTYELLAG